MRGVDGPVIGSPWDTAPPTEPPPEATMCYVDGFAVHERTAPDDAVDPPGLTLPDCFLRDATLAEGTVKPDTTDATVQALPDQLYRDIGMRGNDQPVDGAWDGDEVGKTPNALDLWGGGIDGKHLVTGVAELAEDGVGSRPAASRHAGDGDAPTAKEISYRIWKCEHASTLPVSGPPNQALHYLYPNHCKSTAEARRTQRRLQIYLAARPISGRNTSGHFLPGARFAKPLNCIPLCALCASAVKRPGLFSSSSPARRNHTQCGIVRQIGRIGTGELRTARQMPAGYDT
jgi:hypothetical protein